MTGRAPPFKCSAVISDGDCELTRSGMRPFLWKLGAFWRPFSFRARYDRGATQSCLEQIMSKGTVKWFNPTKGYGFIQPQGGGGRDVFVHISAVERAGLSSLNEGQVVEYEEVSNRGKISAENLKVQR
jgi:CspA family cold shock protein